MEDLALLPIVGWEFAGMSDPAPAIIVRLQYRVNPRDATTEHWSARYSVSLDQAEELAKALLRAREKMKPR